MPLFNNKPKNGKKILIVEDERPLRKAIRSKLEKEGYEVSEAANGLDGVKIAIEEHPDLILLDIVMPVMDGVKMLKELRKDEWGQEVEVIMLTNLTDAVKEMETFQSGVSEYLVKADWKIVDLVKKINQKLS